MCIRDRDHYVRVECKSQKLGFSNYSEAVIPYDEIEFQRKKITVCDTTTFIRNGKPIVWYSKKNNVIEFFNMDGVNPENDAELRKISDHIIEVYVHPVSYTHLDVYKRQVSGSSVNSI